MIRFLLKLYSFLIRQKKDADTFRDIKRLLNSKEKYPTYGELNTRRMVHRALEFYRVNRSFSPLQKRILKRASRGK